MENYLENGSYLVDVKLDGGSGKASVASPARLLVKDQKLTARLEWSSPSYDYMEVGGKGYTPVNEDGNSVFEIELPSMDDEIPVLAETVAMSAPHTVEYTLNFDWASVHAEHTFAAKDAALAAVVVIIAAAVAIIRRLTHAEK